MKTWNIELLLKWWDDKVKSGACALSYAQKNCVRVFAKVNLLGRVIQSRIRPTTLAAYFESNILTRSTSAGFPTSTERSLALPVRRFFRQIVRCTSEEDSPTLMVMADSGAAMARP